MASHIFYKKTLYKPYRAAGYMAMFENLLSDQEIANILYYLESESDKKP